MQSDRFFESTRGKILAALRGARGTAFELAERFGVSPNAVRQQLLILERDGLVDGHPVRRGKTKPTIEYTLTPKADEYFPQQYDRMLNAVLREVRAVGGEGAVQAIFDGIARRSATKLKDRVGTLEPDRRVEGLAALLRERGVQVDYDLVDGRYILREHNCPYAKTVKENPEVCSVIHTMIDEVLPGETRQVESLATGGAECRFEIETSPSGVP
jgi:predicted ArsR family transcriptional regulator